MKDYKLRNILLTGFFFSGFLLGILFVNLWGETYLGGGAFLEQEVLTTIRQTTFDARSLFFYLLKERLSGFVLFWLLGYTVVGIAAYLLLIGWVGFAAGMFMSLFVVQMNLSGILVFLAMLLPQWIFYAAALWISAAAVFERGQQKNTGRPADGGWKKEKTYAKSMLLAGTLVLLALVLESGVNPLFLKFVINYFF